jgi:hypothetical protein
MRRIALGAAALAAALTIGCRTTAPARPSAKSSEPVPDDDAGALSRTFPLTWEEAQRAARDAMADLSINETQSVDFDVAIADARRPDGVPSDMQVHLLGQDPDGRAVKVTLRPDGDGCVVTTRVGRKADPERTRALLDRIAARVERVK